MATRALVVTRGIRVARRHAGQTRVDRLAGAAGRVQPVVGLAGALVAAGRVGADRMWGRAEVSSRVSTLVHILTGGPVALQSIQNI